jgi:hypothetical protein
MALKNPWQDFDRHGSSAIHALDEAVVAKFNASIEKRKNGHLYSLSNEREPQPYFGNPEAPVLLLYANPVINPERDHEEATEEYSLLLDKARKHEDIKDSFLYLNSAYEGRFGYEWWQSTLKNVIEDVGLAAIHQNVFSVELFAYASLKFQAPKELIPTQEYTRWLVKRAISNHATIMLGRAKAEWIQLVPDLQGYINVFQLKNPQQKRISAGNTQPGVYDHLISRIAL